MNNTGYSHPHQVYGLLVGFWRMRGMNPGALIPDIGHFKQESVQTRFANGVLKKWLMRSWAAGSYHNAVKVVLLNNLHKPGLGIGRAGIEILFSIHYVWKTPGIFSNAGHIDHPCDVCPATADKYTHPWFLASDIYLRGILLIGYQRPASINDGLGGKVSSTAGMHYRLGDIHRRIESTGHVDPGARSDIRPELLCFAEAEPVKTYSQLLGQVFSAC